MCDSENVRPIEFDGEFAFHCSDCGAIASDLVDERNDLAEALAIVNAHPEFNFHKVPAVHRRHVLALAQFALMLVEQLRVEVVGGVN
jgi:hypothetical protein